MVSHDEAVTLLQQYALARYEAAGKLVRLDLAEEPIWAWETIIWPEEKLLKGARVRWCSKAQSMPKA